MNLRMVCKLGMNNRKFVGPEGISVEVWKFLKVLLDGSGRFCFDKRKKTIRGGDANVEVCVE